MYVKNFAEFNYIRKTFGTIKAMKKYIYTLKT